LRRCSCRATRTPPTRTWRTCSRATPCGTS
jgi:hypothetical protein